MTEPRDGIEVITLDTPTSGGFDASLRARTRNQLECAQANPAVRGIVLAGNLNAIAMRADNVGLEAPDPLIDCIENSVKPVVAALDNETLDGGFELAFACHGRVAQESNRVGLTSITRGLIPVSGGTQRLPRLVGIESAHDLMSGGQPRSARDFSASGLFDEVVGGGVVEIAVRHANTLADRGMPYPRARDHALDPAAIQSHVDTQRQRLTPRQKLQPAYGALLEALGALALPFDEGIDKERRLFRALMATPAARALHYQAEAERSAVQLPAQLQATPRALRSIAVIGAGTMGSGIAISCLDAGLAVLLLEQDEAALARGGRRVIEHYRERVAAGKLAADAAASNEARLATTTDWTRLAEADVVIEAVFEDLAVKQEVFRRIDSHARPGAVLASNTSYLDLDAVAAATSRPGDVVGLHFFSPAHVMKLLEVVRGATTTSDVIATGMRLGTLLKKLPVLTGNAFGFIGNRIYNAYRRQCEFMLEDGAWPEDVDNALTAFGFAMGPFAVADLSGLDIAWRMRQAQAAHRDPRERYVAILDRLCEMGRLGRKAGSGYYTYTGGKQARTTDTVVRDVVLEASVRRGIVRRALGAEEIQRRALLAMINEAALLLAEGVASRPSDVDVVLVQGYGFPRWEGGPVFWACRQGRAHLEAELQSLARDAGHGFLLANLDPLFAD